MDLDTEMERDQDREWEPDLDLERDLDREWGREWESDEDREVDRCAAGLRFVNSSEFWRRLRDGLRVRLVRRG